MSLTDEELIRKVAEEVMGWVTQLLPSGKRGFVIFDELGSGSYSLKAVDFNPLTDLNHAFMVIERLRELRFTITLTIWDDNEDNDVLISLGSLPISYEGFDDIKNIGHAICMAALKAVENE